MSQDNGGRRLISDYLYQYQEHMEELFWDGSRLKKMKKHLKKKILNGRPGMWLGDVGGLEGLSIGSKVI